MYYVHT